MPVALLAPHPGQRLFLVRHGQTAGNVRAVLTGTGHDPLNDEGQAQAAALGQWFVTQHLDQPLVVSSSYRRAQQTAQAIAQALGVQATSQQGLQEIDPGAWRGRPYAHLSTHADELVQPDGRFGFPEGETLDAVAGRMAAALQPLLSGSRPLIAVSHGGALVALLAALLRQEPAEAWRAGHLSHANTAVTLLESTAAGWALRTLASVDHLNAPQVSEHL